MRPSYATHKTKSTGCQAQPRLLLQARHALLDALQVRTCRRDTGGGCLLCSCQPRAQLSRGGRRGGGRATCGLAKGLHTLLDGLQRRCVGTARSITQRLAFVATGWGLVCAGVVCTAASLAVSSSCTRRQALAQLLQSGLGRGRGRDIAAASRRRGNRCSCSGCCTSRRPGGTNHAARSGSLCTIHGGWHTRVPTR